MDSLLNGFDDKWINGWIVESMKKIGRMDERIELMNG